VAVHDRFSENAASYVLGALSQAERNAFETHLAGCAACAAEVRAFGSVADAIGAASAPAEPPPAARARVLDVVAGSAEWRQAGAPARRSSAAWPWLAVAASLALATGAGMYAMRLRGALAEAERARAVMAAPDLTRIDLAGQPAAPTASARAFLSRSRGLIFTASNLPPLPVGRIYQLWIVTEQAPVSVGVVTPDANGAVEFVSRRGEHFPKAAGVAVTIEPEGGVPAPTGAKYLVGLASGP
jgi:anti-sigma-K factor RskA